MFRRLFVAHRWEWLILSVVSVAFLLLFSPSTSPLFPYEPNRMHGDSTIFQMMGIAMLNGKTLYLDIFDHKGCLLFMVNALGYLLGGKGGLLLLQMLNFLLTLMLWKRTAALLVSRPWLQYAATLLPLSVLVFFMEDGNLSEEWCLPWISLPLYLYVKHCMARRADLPASSLWLIGLSLGIITLIRINNAAAICTLLLCLLVRYALLRRWRYILSSVGWALLGFVVPIVPCVVYFALRAGAEGVFALYDGTLLFNLEYMKSGLDTGEVMAPHYFLKVALPFLLTAVAMGRRQWQWLPLLLAYPLTLLAIGMPRFPHYLCIFGPLLPLSLAGVMQGRRRLVLCALASLFLLWGGVHKVYYQYLHMREDTTTERAFRQEARQLFDQIPVSQRDSTWNLYVTFQAGDVLNDMRFTPMNRIIMPNHLWVTDRYADERGKMPRTSPLWVMTMDRIWVEDVDRECLLSRYELRGVTRSGRINVALYRRRD